MADDLNTEQGVDRPRRAAQRRRGETGFSLVELMVVIVILALLSTFVALNVLPNQEKAMVAKAQSDVSRLDQAIELYKLDMNSFPSVDQGLEALVSQPAGLERPERYREGGYIKGLPTDPWGNPYQYIYPGENGTYDIFSMGADGRLGGEGLDADIGNWRN